METVIIPGTFDPITKGHLDVTKRTASIFDHVIIAVAASESKRERGTLFTLDERIDLIKQSINDLNIPKTSNIEVLPMQGLLVDFAHEHNAHVIVKGLRAYMDFEYEFAQADINTRMDPHLESIFIMAQAKTSCISSSAVRELARLHGNLSEFVTPVVEKSLKDKYN